LLQNRIENDGFQEDTRTNSRWRKWYRK